MTTYSVFIGVWEDDPDIIVLQVGGLTWDAARDALAEKLRQFKNDECPVCRDDGAAALSSLHAAEPGPFEADVDGFDYMIFQSSEPPS